MKQFLVTVKGYDYDNSSYYIVNANSKMDVLSNFVPKAIKRGDILDSDILEEDFDIFEIGKEIKVF